MRALVTGGCGFIGYNLCQELRRRSYDTHIIDNLSTGRRENTIPGGKYVFQDLHKYMDFLVKELKPDVVFHLAAVPRVSYSVEHPYETAHVNIMGTLRVLEAVRKGHPSCRVVNASSSSVYGGADVLPTPESCPLDPQSPYALEKYQSEQWCKMYHEMYGLDVVSLRFFNVFGPHSRFGGAYSMVLSAWLYSLLVDTSVKPYLEGDGEQTRDFCFVDNVVQANILAAEREKPFAGDVYNIAQEEQHSLIGVKRVLERITGKVLHLEMRPPRTGDVRHTLADISKARDELGYKPTNEFEVQVKVMSEWYRTKYGSV